MNHEAIEHLIEQSKLSRNIAGKTLAEARSTELELSKQLQSLQAYRGEYSKKLQTLMAKGSILSVISSYRQFLRSLDGAIHEAQHKLRLQQDTVTESQIEMQNCQKSYYSFDMLKVRKLKATQLGQQRKDAKIEDEISSTAFRQTGNRLSPNNSKRTNK